jgi:hypothetical protein
MSRDLTTSGRRSRGESDPAGYKVIAAQRHAGFFACDRILFLYRPALHAPHIWVVNAEGIVTGEPVESLPPLHDTLPLQLVPLKADHTPLTAADEQTIIASVCEVATHIEGPVAGRLVRLLYRVANDPPFWRSPRISIDINQTLDDLGYSRDSRGYHLAENRARLRDILHALSRVEIRGERFDGRGNREVYVAPMLYIRGGSYNEKETATLDLSRVLEEGLPRKLHLELGWYEGIRRADGRLGNNYLLLPRSLGRYVGAEAADKVATEERLLDFLWMRYSLTRGQSPTLALTLQVALSRAGITNKNITRARQTLEKALERLATQGHIEAFSSLPKDRSGRFTVTLHLPAPEQATVPVPSSAAPVEQTEELPLIHGNELLPLLPATYYSTLWIGGQELAAKTAWYLLWEQAKSHYGFAVAQLFRQVAPLWQVTPCPDGDVLVALYLGVAPGVVRRLQAALAPLEAAVETLYPQQPFGLLVGPFYHAQAEEDTLPEGK